MLGDISYSPGNTVGKNRLWATAAPKHTPLFAPWRPKSACVSLSWKAIHIFVKNKGWEYINLGWDHATPGPSVPAFCSAACGATSHPPSLLPHGSTSAQVGGGLSASRPYQGSWYLVSLFNEKTTFNEQWDQEASPRGQVGLVTSSGCREPWGLTPAKEPVPAAASSYSSDGCRLLDSRATFIMVVFRRPQSL